MTIKNSLSNLKQTEKYSNLYDYFDLITLYSECIKTLGGGAYTNTELITLFLNSLRSQYSKAVHDFKNINIIIKEDMNINTIIEELTIRKDNSNITNTSTSSAFVTTTNTTIKDTKLCCDVCNRNNHLTKNCYLLKNVIKYCEDQGVLQLHNNVYVFNNNYQYTIYSYL